MQMEIVTVIDGQTVVLVIALKLRAFIDSVIHTNTYFNYVVGNYGCWVLTII